MKSPLFPIIMLFILIQAIYMSKPQKALKSQISAPTEEITSTESTTESTTEMQTETTTEAPVETTTEATTVVYKLSTPIEDYDLICNTVMNEAGAEPYEGICAVAQCIYNAIERENKPFSAFYKSYGYTKQKTASETVKKAVKEVFCDGYRVTPAKIIVYYNPQMCKSAWHESNVYICTIGHHRFFAYKGDVY